MSRAVGQELVQAIEEALALVLAAPVAVSELARLSGGSSRETWGFKAIAADHPAVELVLQRERPGGARAATGMAVEAGLLRAAAASGVPVPKLLAAEGDPEFSAGPVGSAEELGGPWMIAERIAGETIARRILRDDAFVAARSVLAAQCGEALAAIHKVPPTNAPGLTAEDPVAQYKALLDQLGQPHPALELGLRWLVANRPDPVSPKVVHGDFRLGNLVVDEHGLSSVLDWELAHLGDPLEDLAWLCVRAWRFGSPLPVGGFAERDELIAAYEQASQQSVDKAALHWWEVMGNLKWGVICVMQVSAHLLGLTRSVELAAIGRRVCEAEHDLLELLESSP